MSRSESETRMRGKCDVTLYYCNDAFPIPLLQYLWSTVCHGSAPRHNKLDSASEDLHSDAI